MSFLDRGGALLSTTRRLFAFAHMSRSSQMWKLVRGMAVGVVEDGKHSSLKVGDLVQGMLGWQTYYIGPGSELTPMPVFRCAGSFVARA